MTNILDQIVDYKKTEVAESKITQPVKLLERTEFFSRTGISLNYRLNDPDSPGIIAEFKRKSPSKGILNDKADPVQVVKQYEAAGVAGSSVLTDTEFFGGSKNDLQHVRSAVNIPLLRKDFMIDEYQFIEAKSIGADVVLLIASILTKNEVRRFTDLAHNLGLEVLLELHGEEELDHVYHQVNMVGINNRNLKTFEVDMERSIKMAEQLKSDFTLIAESGISAPGNIIEFRKFGFTGFLIGETFMRTDQPGQSCHDFIQQLKG